MTVHQKSIDMPHGYRVTFTIGASGFTAEWEPRIPKTKRLQKESLFMQTYLKARDEFISEYATMTSGGVLGACPRIASLLRKSWIWPDFPIIFVKYAQYSPQMIEKSESNQLSLAT
ncbi:MAG: hypothetical protein GY792_18365, partial [Gammaproteobacteria bacterium]|nr:hypothetical protein [Gammaproteobacteria bacterium]